jgi:HEAT repeat protein
VRKHAITALQEIGDKRAIEPLIRALDDKDLLVRSLSAEALRNISHKRDTS